MMTKYQKLSFLVQKWAKNSSMKIPLNISIWGPKNLFWTLQPRGWPQIKKNFTRELPLGGRFKPIWEMDFKNIETNTDI